MKIKLTILALLLSLFAIGQNSPEPPRTAGDSAAYARLDALWIHVYDHVKPYATSHKDHTYKVACYVIGEDRVHECKIKVDVLFVNGRFLMAKETTKKGNHNHGLTEHYKGLRTYYIPPRSKRKARKDQEYMRYAKEALDTEYYAEVIPQDVKIIVSKMITQAVTNE